MALNRWWAGSPVERFWLESTDRQDIGQDLRAPLTDDTGSDNWRYTILKNAHVGDLVLHYDKAAQAINAVSRIASDPFEEPILWAARGTSARGRNARPQVVPGFRIALDRHRKLSAPLTLARLRAEKTRLEALHDALRARTRGEAIYFPFELSQRDVRPLQGYGFKVPAAFVAAFPELASLAEDEATASSRLQSEIEIFAGALAAMETRALNYAIGGLQRERAQRLGLKRTATHLFSRHAKADDWAFHHGGRGELQFNIGLDWLADGSRAFRVGLAFSLEPSRTLPDISVFEGRVARFNSFLREHPETYADLSQWWWQGGVRSPDAAPGPIPGDLFREGVFIFLGDRQRLENLDPERALAAFDRLLPLYRWVEGEPISPEPPSLAPVLETLRLDGGREIDGGHWISASRRAQTFDIFLRHAEAQRRLKAALVAEGCDKVLTEVPIGHRWIDLVAWHGQEMWFYEVKIATSVRACLREAIGQLLEYALWPGATAPARLVVVGEHALDPVCADYLQRLNASFPIPLIYRQQALEP